MSTLHAFIVYVVGTGNQTVVIGPAPIVFANPDLKWETSTQGEFGADIILLQGKIRLTSAYYVKTTTDILLGYPAPYTSYSSIPFATNLGVVLNSGIQLSLNFRNN